MGCYPKSDARKPNDLTELLGQVITPKELAVSMARFLLEERMDGHIRILDPCVGPSTFPAALHMGDLIDDKTHMTLVDIDEAMILRSKKWCFQNGVSKVEYRTGDYLVMPMDEQFDYVILNPPYVRQEWLGEKKLRYQALFEQRYGCSVPMTSNLYVYFLVKALNDLRPGGQLVAVVYDSWISTLYGRWLLDYINENTVRLEVLPSLKQPFTGRLIDATVIRFEKSVLPRKSLKKETTNLRKPSYFSSIAGVELIERLFKSSRRGLRLKQTSIFMTGPADVSRIGATAFVKKVGKIKGYKVPHDHEEAALLIEPKHEKEGPIYAELESRVKLALKNPDDNRAILAWYREHPNSWFTHNPAPEAPIIFNYYLRNRPRHILNQIGSYSDNFYGLTPDESIPLLAWLAALNSTMVCCSIYENARNMGGGLAKIQLFEYRDVLVPDLGVCTPREQQRFADLGYSLISGLNDAEKTIEKIDRAIHQVYSESRLKPKNVWEFYKQLRMEGT